jgi:uncharacterized protein
MQLNTSDILSSIRKKIQIIAPHAKVFLFGSRARANAASDSDWDILILLDKDKIENSDYDNIAYPLFELGWNLNQQFSVKMYTVKEWEKRNFTPFYKNVEKEGIQL